MAHPMVDPSAPPKPTRGTPPPQSPSMAKGTAVGRLTPRCRPLWAPPGCRREVDKPSGHDLAADPGIGYLGGRGGHAVEHFFSREGPPLLADRATAAGELALDEPQDYVDEESTEPWAGQDSFGSGSSSCRGPRGEAVHVVCGRGDEVLTLEAIELQETAFGEGQ
jgi:hypothetical protein